MNLILFTDKFPYRGSSAESALIMPELELLSSRFDHVVIVPDSADGDVERQLPAGIDLLPLFGKGCQAGSLKSILSRHFRKYCELRTGAAERRFVSGAVRKSDIIKRWIDAGAVNLSDTLFYTFEFSDTTAALYLVSLEKPLRMVSRCADPVSVLNGQSRIRRDTVAALTGCFAESYDEDAPCRYSNIYKAPLGSVKTDVEVMAPHHIRADRKVSFISYVGDKAAAERIALFMPLLKALAVARRDTQVRWLILVGSALAEGIGSVAADVPDNFTVEVRRVDAPDGGASVYRAEASDWFVDLGGSGWWYIPVYEALSYGVPVITSAGAGLDTVVDDDSALILSPEPTVEEFVRGIAPYLDSDFRMSGMRDAAAGRWRKEYDAAVARRGFVNKIVNL